MIDVDRLVDRLFGCTDVMEPPGIRIAPGDDEVVVPVADRDDALRLCAAARTAVANAIRRHAENP